MTGLLHSHDRGRSRKRRKNEPRTSAGAGRIVLMVAVLISLFPLYWMFVVASNSSAAINDIPPRVVPGQNFLHLAGEVFQRTRFLRALVNSLIVATSVAVCQVVFSTMAGFAFAKLSFRGSRMLLLMVIVTMMVPPQLGVIPLLIMTAEFGWANTLQAVIAPNTVTAFGVFWMRQLIDETVPDEIVEAARIDGASSFRLYRSIVLPQIRPSVTALGIFAFMQAWNDFLWPLVVLNGLDTQTVQVALRQIQNQAYTTDFGVDMAGTFIATTPLLLLFVLVGRRIVDNISVAGPNT